MNPAYVLLGLVILGVALFSWSATAEDSGRRDDGPAGDGWGTPGRVRRWVTGAAWLALGLGVVFLVEIAPVLILEELFPMDEPTGIDCPSPSPAASDPAAHAAVDHILLALDCPTSP